MAKVFNVQTEGGQGEIQDYDLHQQTAVQTVAATDYVMLQDTNGAYHKILRNSLVDALRDVLGASIGGAALGTDIQKIPALGTNDALGFGTLANLASVLGGIKIGDTLSESVDVNSILETSAYDLSGYNQSQYAEHLPTGVSNGTLFTVNSGYYKVQILETHAGLNNRAFIRFHDGSWQTWRELSTDIPSFYKNYANLSALRTAIGKMEFVDMGLPSGRMWASKNIGAETITDDGLYFSWGNVDGHTGSDGYDFGSRNDGPYANTEGAALTADITINNDAANFYLGGTCKMPTVADFQELSNNCDSEWVTLHGVTGRRFTSRINGKSIFFPASGYRYGTSLNNHGSDGNYWSSSLYSSARGYGLSFNSSGVDHANYINRFNGFSVRAVQ